MNWPSGYDWKKIAGPLITVAALGIGIACVWGPKLRGTSARTASPNDLEYFNSTATFSEVESARATLEAEALRYITVLRQTHVRLRMEKTSDGADRGLAFKEWLASLKTKANEFKGTLQESKIVQEIFMVARMGQLKSEWLDEYVRLLYETPTQPLIAAYTNEALDTARELKRERDLIRAFIHLLQAPVELENKLAIQRALTQIDVTLPARWSKFPRHAGNHEHASGKDCAVL